ncbi:unnamed protein product [Effrenium voratum]|nr:unnamed protein product [Effrenium voratum]
MSAACWRNFIATGLPSSLSLLTLLEDAEARRFLLLSAAFVSIMQISAIIEEYIYVELPGFDGFYWTVALVELAIFAISAWLARWKEFGLFGALRQPVVAPMRLYVAMAVLLGLSQGLGKVTFRYMNYATNTIIKSAKLVPTLLISVLWLRRKISLPEWAAAVLLVTSTALFSLGEKAATPSFNPAGLGIAAVQLLFAALQGNLQEKALKDHGAPISEALAYSNLMGVFVVMVGVQVSGEMGPALSFFGSSPLALGLLLLRSCTFFLGALALIALTKEYGTGAATAVGTARKSLTVLLSFLIFPKPFHVRIMSWARLHLSLQTSSIFR